MTLGSFCSFCLCSCFQLDPTVCVCVCYIVCIVCCGVCVCVYVCVHVCGVWVCMCVCVYCVYKCVRVHKSKGECVQKINM